MTRKREKKPSFEPGCVADALGVAAGLLDQALDVELDGGTQLDQEVSVVHAASLLRGLADMAAEYRRTAA